MCHPVSNGPYGSAGTCLRLLHNSPLKRMGVRDIIIILGDFSFFVAVFHWMRIEISRKFGVFRGREDGFGADS